MSEPIVVTAYRGEHGAVIDGQTIQTKLGSISFGTVAAAKQYALDPNRRDDVVVDPRVMKAELTITKPVMNNPDDPFIDFTQIIEAIGIDKTKIIASELKEHVFHTDNWDEFAIEKGEELGLSEDSEIFDYLLEKDAQAMLSELYMDAYPVFDSQKYVDWFKAEGFDGVVQGGNGSTACEIEYKVFDPSQIKVIKTFDLKEDRNLEGSGLSV